MSSRLQHALRFALPDLVAILAVALVYELVGAFVLGDVPRGMTPAGAVAANMAVWARIATVVAAMTFLLRLSDVVTRVPGWGFAWLEAAWVGLMCVVVVRAIEAGAVEKAVLLGAGAVVLWLSIHRLIPGWPGAAGALAGADEPGEQEQRTGRHLP